MARGGTAGVAWQQNIQTIHTIFNVSERRCCRRTVGLCRTPCRKLLSACRTGALSAPLMSPSLLLRGVKISARLSHMLPRRADFPRYISTLKRAIPSPAMVQ